MQDVTISWNSSTLPSRTVVTLTDLSNSVVTNMRNTGLYRMKCMTKPTRVKISVGDDGTSAPSPPANVSVEKKSNNSLYISWDKSPESSVTGYKVHYVTSSGRYERAIDVRNVTNYNLLNVTAELQYNIAVSAYDSTGAQSEKSSEVTATVYGSRKVQGEAASGSGTVTCQSPVAYESSSYCTIAPSAGYQIDSVNGCAGTLAGTSYSISYVIYDCTVSASFSLIPVSLTGYCGTANGQTVTIAPSGNLCKSGVATAVTGNGPWSWSCTGENGGGTASCGASLQQVAVAMKYVVNGTTSGNGNISCASPIPAGEGGYCTVAPATGYLTAGVSGCGGTLSGNTYSFGGISSDCTVSASFTQIPVPVPSSEQIPNTGATANAGTTTNTGATTSSTPVYLGTVSDYKTPPTTSTANDTAQNRDAQTNPLNDQTATGRIEQQERQEVKREKQVTKPTEAPKSTAPSGQHAAKIVFTKNAGLQESFRTYNGEKTPGILAALCNTPATQYITQKPAFALSDGKQVVTLELRLDAKEVSAPNISINGAKLISTKRSGDGLLVVEVLPEKGIVDPAIYLMTRDKFVEFPITVVPPLLIKATDKGFKRFLAAAALKQLTTAADLNGDGKYNYLDDYIYTVNYVALKSELLSKKSEQKEKTAKKKNSSVATTKKSLL